MPQSIYDGCRFVKLYSDVCHFLAGSARPLRRAPKVTVTRGGDSLCQKGCYPMAVLFLCFGLLCVGKSWRVR